MSHQIILKKDRKVKKPEKSNFKLNKRNIYYIIDLGLLVSFMLIFITGLLKLLDIYGYIFYPTGFLVNVSIVHNWSGLSLGIIGSLHAILHLKWFVRKTKQLLRGTKTLKPKQFRNNKRRILTYVLNLTLGLSSIILLVTGILKIPGVLAQLGLYPQYSFIFTLLHDWNGFIFGCLIFTHIALHWNWLTATTHRVWNKLKYGKIIVVLSASLFLAFPMVPMGLNIISPENPKTEEISIQLVGRFYFSPENIETVRPDIYKNGHFSIFDILVYLDKTGEIHMQYHFRADLNT